MKNTTFMKSRQQGKTLTLEKMIAARKVLQEADKRLPMPQYVFSAELQKFFHIKPTFSGISIVEMDSGIKPKDPTRDAEYHFPVAESKPKMVK